MWDPRSPSAARAANTRAAPRPGRRATRDWGTDRTGRLSATRIKVSQLIVFLALAFSIVIAIFAVQNTTPVAVQFLTFRAEAVAVSVLVLISAALGAAAILLLGFAREVSWRWRHRGVTQQLRTAQSRVAELEATRATAEPAQPALTPPSEPTAPIESPEAKPVGGQTAP